MHFNFQKHQSKQLIQDYIGWRLAKKSYTQWIIFNKIDINKNSKSKFCLMMRQLAYEFEKQYKKAHQSFQFQFEPSEANLKDIFNTLINDLFDLSTDSLNLDNDKLSENCINLNFSLYSKDTFNLKCNWSKLIGLFAFSGCLAIQLYELKADSLIYSLNDLLVDFINNDKRIFTWISSQGSWNGLVDYYNERQIYLDDSNNDNLKNSCVSYVSSSYSTNLLSRTVSDSVLNGDNDSYLQMLRNQFKQSFLKLSQYAAVGVGSIGVLVLGAFYMKKRI